MTPFAQLELQKQAGFNPAKLISTGMGWAGRNLRRGAVNAKKMTYNKSLASDGLTPEVANHLGPGMLKREAARASTAAQGVGNVRMTTGRALGDARRAIDKSPGIQSAINIGGATALAGAGMYGTNRMGHASGVEEGVGQGVDAGMTAGLEAASNQVAQNKPGYLGGLMGALRGQSGGSVNMGQAYGDLGNNRQMLINQLMGR